jgi:transcriptional regulator with GAF, ATPase, and Fis domain
LRREIEKGPELTEIVGESPALKSALAQARAAAINGQTVLMVGETGTGKELIARAIHRMGARRKQSFIKLDCSNDSSALLEAALLERYSSRFEAANLGTLLIKDVERNLIVLAVGPKYQLM